MSYFKNREQEDKMGPVWGLASMGEGRMGRGIGGECGGNSMYSCIKMKK
jgi:hypothetical protein